MGQTLNRNRLGHRKEKGKRKIGKKGKNKKRKKKKEKRKRKRKRKRKVPLACCSCAFSFHHGGENEWRWLTYGMWMQMEGKYFLEWVPLGVGNLSLIWITQIGIVNWLTARFAQAKESTPCTLHVYVHVCVCMYVCVCMRMYVWRVWALYV